MKEYLLSITGVVLFSSVLMAVLPSGKMNELIKGITRIACLLCIISPVVNFFVGNENNTSIFAESGIETQNEFIEYCCNERIASLESRIRLELESISNGIKNVELVWDMNTMAYGKYQVEEIEILAMNVYTLKDEPVDLKDKITEYISKQYQYEGRIEVIENASQ